MATPTNRAAPVRAQQPHPYYSHVIRTKMGTSAKLRLQVELPNGIRMTLCRLKPSSSVALLKTRLEQEVALLPHTYHLTYLDACPMEHGGTLHEQNLADGALLKAVAWRLWRELVVAALLGDAKRCCEELRTMAARGDQQWGDYCAWCAMYMAAHSGHYVLLSELFKERPALAVNGQSPSGWTALHAAAAMGRWKALCVLLDHGADVRLKDR